MTALMRAPISKATDETKLIFGVCAGIAKHYDVDPWTIRLLWLLSVVALGSGLILYPLLAVLMPTEGEPVDEKKILGVCNRISLKTGIDASIVRILAIVSAFAFVGVTIVAYGILHFVLSEEDVVLIEDNNQID